ncbi:hypothetical protein IGJ34_002939 [Enterococcus sp. AZ177]
MIVTGLNTMLTALPNTLNSCASENQLRNFFLLDLTTVYL